MEELNIPSTVKDPHYRYKMPKIQITVQGSGNGIKTNWLNLPDVSNALKVPVEYPIKFIGKELGSNIDIKTNSYLINGSHDVEKMQELLDKFIKKYVLCPKCKLPEIHGKIKVKKDKNEIKCTCRSCGTISKLDSTHDFATYIKRNPPPYEKDTTPAASTTSKISEKKEKTEIDKKLKKSIKECCIKLPSVISDKESTEKNIENIKKFIGNYNFNLDIKFYCFTFGIIPNEIYSKAFEHRLPIIKHFVFNESDNNSEAALYYLLLGLQDYIFSRQKGENEKYVSSVLYYFYDRDILSEDFWISYLNNEIQEKYKSILNVSECEKKFKEAAKDFSNWIENGPYEDDEEDKNEKKENKEEKKKEKGKKNKKKKDKKKDEEEDVDEEENKNENKDEKKEEKDEKGDKDKKEDKEDKDKKEEKEDKDKKDEEEEIDIDNI